MARKKHSGSSSIPKNIALGSCWCGGGVSSKSLAPPAFKESIKRTSKGSPADSGSLVTEHSFPITMIPGFFRKRRAMVSRNNRFCTTRHTRIEGLHLSRNVTSIPLSRLVTNHPPIATTHFFTLTTPHRRDLYQNSCRSNGRSPFILFPKRRPHRVLRCDVDRNRMSGPASSPALLSLNLNPGREAKSRAHTSILRGQNCRQRPSYSLDCCFSHLTPSSMASLPG